MPQLPADLKRALQAALAHHRAGNIDAAEALYRKVLQHRPSQPDALNLLGVIAQERGRPAWAVQLIGQALRARRQFPEALTNLARAQRAAGDAEGAVHSARRATALAPDLAEAHLQLGRALLDTNDNENAAAACRRVIALAPGSLEGHVNLAAALMRLQDHLGAAKVYQVAHALKPDRAETLTDFAAALTELERYDDALNCHQRAIGLAPGSARAHAGHAATLKAAQDVAGAVEACERSLALNPEQVPMWLLLGGSLSALGRFAEAVACYRRALELDPDCTDASRGMVAAGERIEDASELARLAATVGNPAVPSHQRIAAGYALGSLLDRAGDYDAAFANFATANGLLHAKRGADGKSFDIGALRRHVDMHITGYTAELLAATRTWGDTSDLPVFIVGMPRSGTTLAEQIAASHPAVFGAGERKDIGRIAHVLGADTLAGPPKHWDAETVHQEAAAHLAYLRRLAGPKVRVTDKMPDNVFWLGLIAILYPRARIVICRRDLRDVCLSCYFQSFGAGLPWSNDLIECAERALQVERLVRHWRSVLPLPILEVSYEAVIADPEGESRRLIDFLGLPWDPACLAFHETQRQVMTASLWQVRQPLYATSVGRWRRYRRHIAPLIERLSAALPNDGAEAAA